MSLLDGPETQLHDIIWAIHDGKNRGRSEGEENIGGVLGYGGWSRAEQCAFLSYTYARVRGVALKLNPSEASGSN